jgi:hypothetical protein
VATSAKRLGMQVDDLELEHRLRRIEGELEKKAIAIDFGDGTSSTKRVATIPQVIGLRVTGKTPGAITLAWNQVSISDLRRYEVDIAEDLSFTTNKQTFNVASTSLQYNTVEEEGGGGNTSVFARVRARTRSGNVGNYSVVLNAITGQAQTDDIADDAVTDDKIDPDAPITFAGLNDSDVGSKLALRGYIDGLIMATNATNPTTDIDIAAGIARDETNAVSMRLASTLVKQIDNAWAVGTNAGGMPSSLAVSNSTWYHVFLASNSAKTIVDVAFDTSVTAATIAADTPLSIFRRIGSVLTDGSANIIKFIQDGDDFWWDVPVQEYNSASTGNTAILQTMSTPLGIQTKVKGTFHLHSTVGLNNSMLVTTPAQTDTAPDVSLGLFHVRVQPNGSNNDDDSVMLEILTDTSSRVRWRTNNTSASLTARVTTHGWVDRRGKNA